MKRSVKTITKTYDLSQKRKITNHTSFEESKSIKSKRLKE